MNRVLLVEDNGHNSRLIDQLLMDMDIGIELSISATGKGAIQLANDNDFDLVIMDVSLPDMNGIDVTKEIKRNMKYNEVPFIVATAHAMSNEEALFKETFDDYISKPIDDDVFTEKINKWLGVK
ncbi:response regulator [Clostridium sp. Marseille-P299]|uniref:response regulator n=1 Tax=Clostridium sp. Marseille-P299 TaxID=1805477 RepID=UPI00082AB262|nr:response regulator [Clostridium sp. Marseille-P299]